MHRLAVEGGMVCLVSQCKHDWVGSLFFKECYCAIVEQRKTHHRLDVQWYEAIGEVQFDILSFSILALLLLLSGLGTFNYPHHNYPYLMQFLRCTWTAISDTLTLLLHSLAATILGTKIVYCQHDHSTSDSHTHARTHTGTCI